MRTELAILAQSLERQQIELDRQRAIVADILAQVRAAEALVGAALPVAAPARPRPATHHQEPTSESPDNRVAAVIEAADGDLTVAQIAAALTAQSGPCKMTSLRCTLSNLAADGRIQWVRRGVYGKVVPPLQLVQG